MEMLLSILLLIGASAVCSQDGITKSDFLVVYDLDLNSFIQIYLNKTKHVKLPRKSPKENFILKIFIVPQNNDLIKLHYTTGRGISTYQTTITGEAIEKDIPMEFLDGKDFQIIYASKDSSNDVYYLNNLHTIYQLVNGKLEELVNVEATKFIKSTSYDPNKKILYYFECNGNDSLVGFRVVDRKKNSSKPVQTCLDSVEIDHKGQQMYGLFGNLIYTMKLDDQNSKMEIFHEIDGIFGLAVGSKHVYYTIRGHRTVYRIEKNQEKKMESFYLMDDPQVIAIHEGSLIEDSPSASGSTSSNVIASAVIAIIVLLF